MALGRQLGGARGEGFRDYMDTNAFREGMDELVDLAKRRPTAVFCREAFYFRCQRKYIADELVRSGWVVQHVLDSRRTFKHGVGSYRMSLQADVSE